MFEDNRGWLQTAIAMEPGSSGYENFEKYVSIGTASWNSDTCWQTAEQFAAPAANRVSLAERRAIDFTTCRAAGRAINCKPEASGYPALPDTVRSLISSSLSANTKRGYAADLAHFRAWGGKIPSSPGEIAAYLAEGAEIYAVATLQRRQAALSKAHRAIGTADPCRTEIVEALMQGIRRTCGVAQRQAQALLRDDLFAVLDCLEDRPKDIRDRALLLLGWATAMRRSELVALDVGDVEFTTKGALVTVRRSKTDQDGRGREIAVPFGRTLHCPIAALKDWLALTGIETGPIFTTVNKHGHVLKKRMSGEAASNVVKARVADAGYDPAAFSGHSLRAGFVTAAALAGASAFKIRETTGHRSDSGLAPYLRTINLSLSRHLRRLRHQANPRYCVDLFGGGYAKTQCDVRQLHLPVWR